MSDRYPQFPNAISVTEVIKAAGMMGNMDFSDPWYMERGTAVHEATAFYDRGTLDESTVDPRIQGYIESWKKFRADTNYVPAFTEKPLLHSIYGYCGTLDRNGLDIKTGSPAAWHIIQGAAYNDLEIEHSLTTQREWRTVYLQDDGNYKVHPCKLMELREALKIFTAALAVVRWRQNNLKEEI